LTALINLITYFYLWSLLRHMKHATNDFMTRARTHTHTQSLSLEPTYSIIFMILFAVLTIP